MESSIGEGNAMVPMTKQPLDDVQATTLQDKLPAACNLDHVDQRKPKSSLTVKHAASVTKSDLVQLDDCNDVIKAKSDITAALGTMAADAPHCSSHTVTHRLCSKLEHVVHIPGVLR
jgi:hypothetical protein